MHECDGLKKSAVPNGIGNNATLPPTVTNPTYMSNEVHVLPENRGD
jgi:hypothetical protein